MKILLTGANGYIGKRLLPVLLEKGHQVIACVRDSKRFDPDLSDNLKEKLEVFQVDFLKEIDFNTAPLDFDIAYYLIHSMSDTIGDFREMEARTAENFKNLVDHSNAQQIIYLSGIVNESSLSEHLKSRFNVEKILGRSKAALTVLRAGIIVGSGSASFEIIRDLVEKLPIMVAPKWLNTRTQPIAIRNVIDFLYGVALREDCYDKQFDIGGPDVLTYKDMLLKFSKVRGLKRWIITVPVMTPRLSSYWLYFVTSTSYSLAVNLVESMGVEVVAKPNDLHQRLGIELISYEEAVDLAFQRIEQNMVISSWKDALVTSSDLSSLTPFMQVPVHGCFKDIRKQNINEDERKRAIRNIWRIGGDNGWYYGTWLWKFRGFLDKLMGGVGLRRGRTNPDSLHPGDALDFWRVIAADQQQGRLLLYAEMKLPGEAWLEFNIKPISGSEQFEIKQTATFRPRGVWGRMYWFGVLPFHFFIFPGMLNRVVYSGGSV